MPFKTATNNFLSIIFLILLGVVAYANSLHVPFQFDDGHTIVYNPILQQLNDLGAIWRYDPSRFLTHLSFAVNYYIGGENVFGYHVVNIVVHLMNGLFVYLITHQLVAQGAIPNKQQGGMDNILACFATGVFLVHPLQTQAVTYIVQRATTMAAFGYLGAVLFYIKYRRGKSITYLILSLLLAVVGVFSKPIIITLPLAILLVELGMFPRPEEKPWRSLLPIALYIAVVMATPALLALWKYKSMGLPELTQITRETLRYSRSEYLFTQLKLILNYYKLLLVPVGQSVDYHFTVEKTFFSLPVIIGALTNLALLIVSAIFWKRNRLISFGVLWFFITMSLESSIFPIQDLFFEHRLYLPMMGFAFVLAGLLCYTSTKKNLLLILAGGIVGVYMFLTIQRNMVWQNTIQLWKNAAQTAPNKSRVHIYLGNAYMDTQQYEKALGHFDQALQINPASAKSYNNRGLIHLMKGRYRKAIEDFRLAIQFEPEYLDAHSNLGNTYQLIGDFDKAITSYQKALAINDRHVASLSNMAKAYAHEGRKNEALSLFERLVKIAPDNPQVYFDMANIYQKKRDLKKAVEQYNQAVRLDPDYGDAYYNLGIIYAQMNEVEKAIQAYKEAITADSGHMRARNNLAVVYYQTEQYQKAIDQIDKAMAKGYQPNPHFLELLNRHRQ